MKQHLVMSLSKAQRVSIVLACAFALAGCSTVKGWFGAGKNDKKAAEPAALTDFAPTAKVTRLWSAGAGKGEGLMGARQAPAVADGHVYAAAVEGGVRAFDLQSGQAQWHYEPKAEKDKEPMRLAGGPGAGGGSLLGLLGVEIVDHDHASQLDLLSEEAPRAARGTGGRRSHRAGSRAPARGGTRRR